MSQTIFPIFDTMLPRSEREAKLGQRAKVIWMVGLSGSGKSTLARALEIKLHQQGFTTQLLDGDNLRHGLCADLGFTDADRNENLRRAAEVAKLFVHAGVITICSFISPLLVNRLNAKQIIGDDDFIEVFIDCPFDECAKRDVKGLYKRALAGQIKNFTGLDAPFEAPINPDILINTKINSLEQSLNILLDAIGQRVNFNEK